MITLSYNQESAEYDAYALLSSFYPSVASRQLISAEALGCADELHVKLYEDGGALLSFSAGESFGRKASYHFTPHGDEREIKWARKLFFYDSLADYSGRTLPWGALTGVRPTKLILGIVKERGFSKEELIRHMYTNYRVSEEKAALGYDIAMREDSLLAPHRESGISVYIGIPFCPSRCIYCSFLSYPIENHKDFVADYLDCVEAELVSLRDICAQKIDTLYIGGGTPTALSEQELERLLKLVDDYIMVDKLFEYTVEAGRPDSLNAAKLRAMKAHGVSRISVNPQSFKEETLALIGRRHSVSQLYEAFHAARGEGFDNINMDLILGLPGEGLSDIEHSLSCVRELKPDALTVHSLALKRASRMREWVAEHGSLTGMDYYAAMRMASERADSLGMQPYYLYRQKNIAGALENTGFAREGRYGLYNILIMEEVQSIYAIGAGTVSKRVDADGTIRRCDTHKDLRLYISDIEAMIERKRRMFAEEK